MKTLHLLSSCRSPMVGLMCAFSATAWADSPHPGPTTIDYATYFAAMPRNAQSQCGLEIREDAQHRKVLAAKAPVTNPAMTCPDMFSWKLFAEIVLAGFAQQWATDQEVWPNNPWPLCDASISSQCCRADGLNNDASHCPSFPGSTPTAFALTPGAGTGPKRQGRLPALLRLSGQLGVPARAASDAALTAHLGAPAQSPDDPTRLLRQENNELVFRNRPMFDYILQNGLYYQQGLSTVFANNARDIKNNAPYHQRNQTRSLATIEFPVEAVMVKANFVTPELAAKAGLKEDPDYPVIKARFHDDKGVVRTFWMIAFHISSKDTPNWVWATFEYVNNVGRCDFAGCNDSYGYATAVPNPGLAGNYTPPHQVSDNFGGGASPVFALNGTYPAESLRDEFKAVLDQLGIGTGPNEIPPVNPDNSLSWFPSPSDKAWRSYRLKGSQVNFTDAAGRTSLLGNSVTESGFVTSSSCITCHSRANANQQGQAAIGVFEPVAGYQGYPLSSNGTPNPAWFNQSSKVPLPLAVQTDFVWGFLNANPTQ